ncbi:type I-B CRISPR-associated protein Cas7/Cst2/DevR [Dehalococcoidia bacterium]|nr:type I-B CRISPR-associated protein Cas7/Cst2/DevR [Dehalococcoidia bacterium]
MAANNKPSKCANIVFVFKTSVGSVNASFSEDNVSVVKKITLPNGDELPYISGQAMRRYIRDKWAEMALPISPVTQTATAAGRAASSKCDPAQYIDDDLFGFMLAAGQDVRKRTSPVRVSPAIAFFRSQDDRDLGVRITEEGKQDPTRMMPPFETEAYYNYFRCNVLIELSRAGVFGDDNYGTLQRPSDLGVQEKADRLKALVHAIRNLWGGGKQTRFLTDIQPKFVVYTRQTSIKPIFLERLEMSEDESIASQSITDTLTDEAHIIQCVLGGVVNGFGKLRVGNELTYQIGDEQRQKQDGKLTLLSIGDAFDQIAADLVAVMLRATI